MDLRTYYKHSFIINPDIKDKILDLNKLLLVMAYIQFNVNRKNKLYISIDMIVKGIGYKPNTRPRMINEKVINQLLWLETHNHICICTENISKINSKECFLITVSEFENDIFDMRTRNNSNELVLKKYLNSDITIDKNNRMLYEHDKFVLLEDYEFEAITTLQSIDKKTDFSSGKDKIDTNKDIMLRVFLNIKKRICMSDDTPKICYVTHKKLCSDCSITSTGSVNKAICDLEKLGILYVYRTGSYVVDGETRNMFNYYAVDKKELDEAYCDAEAKQWLKDHRGIEVKKFDPIAKPNTKKKVDIDISCNDSDNEVPEDIKVSYLNEQLNTGTY
jgi:hypothetical protein